MKPFVSLFAIALLFIAGESRSQEVAGRDPLALGYAREIVNAIMPPERRGETATSLMRALIAQMREVRLNQFSDPGIRQILDAHLNRAPELARPVTDKHMPLMLEAVAQAYVREFSLSELREINAFAKTPTGAHYLSRSSAIMSDPSVAAANQAYFADIQQISRASEAEFRKAMTDYLSKHPEVARKIKQQQTNNTER